MHGKFNTYIMALENTDQIRDYISIPIKNPSKSETTLLLKNNYPAKRNS